jgi:crossover junction endodeoxyribonuclease RuvC
MRLVGLDPGLQRTGWGVIEVDGSRLRYVACGIVASGAGDDLATRLKDLYAGLAAMLAEQRPSAAAVEETVVNRNALSSLKLGHARAVALLAAAHAGLPVAEYASRAVKRAVVGTGAAHKTQIVMMVRRLLPGAAPATSDAADALAVAICHAHHLTTGRRIEAALAAAR